MEGGGQVLDLSGSGWGQLGGCFYRVNEQMVSIKFEFVTDKMRNV